MQTGHADWTPEQYHMLTSLHCPCKCNWFHIKICHGTATSQIFCKVCSRGLYYIVNKSKRTSLPLSDPSIIASAFIALCFALTDTDSWQEKFEMVQSGSCKLTCTQAHCPTTLASCLGRFVQQTSVILVCESWCLRRPLRLDQYC